MDTTSIETTDTADSIPPAGPLEPIGQLVERLTIAALALPRDGYCIDADLIVDLTGAIDIEPPVGIDGRHHRRITVQMPSLDPHPDDATWCRRAIEHELLADHAGGPSLLAVAARTRAIGGAIEGHTIVRQVYDDGTWHVATPAGAVALASIASIDEGARKLGGLAGSRLIAAYAWAALGYPAACDLRIVPAMSSPLPQVIFGVTDYALDSVDAVRPWDAPIHGFTALRRRDALADLPADSDPIAQELYLARTTGNRAESRRRAAAAALCQYLADQSWTDRADIVTWVHGGGPALGDVLAAELTDGQRDALGVIAALEVHGIGGPGGYAGDATVRMSWASRLGKGRRQASDGAAWTAAIGSLATSRPSPEQVAAALPYLRHCDLEWPMAYALAQAAECMTWDAEAARAWCAVARAVYARATAPDAPYTMGGAVALGDRYRVDVAGAS